MQGSANPWGPRLREFFRQVEAEVISNCSNKIHQTWGPWISRSLYKIGRNKHLGDSQLTIYFYLFIILLARASHLEIDLRKTFVY